MKTEPRIAFFPDSFIEVNGVAHTSRQLVEYTRTRRLPMLCVHGADGTRCTTDGSVTKLALRRGAIGFALDAELHSDLLFLRHSWRVLAAVHEFKADLIHITGPNDTGQLGAYVAWKLGLPLVISWHTNVHEYAAQRLRKALPWLPRAFRAGLAQRAEALTLRAAMRFYELGRALLAPNEELRTLLAAATGKPVHLMQRGVNTTLFSPIKRARQDSVFQIGYVGRLTPEKNVRLLAELESHLLALGHKRFRFVIIGAGTERAWLERHLRQARFPGVLRGEALARAYAELDLFVFPSATDTFGNVVLEAQASGVPALVSTQGGPKFIIEDSVTGLCATTADDFASAAAALMTEHGRLAQMAEAARQRACTFAWEEVFARVYEIYEDCLQSSRAGHSIAAENHSASMPPIAAR
jgi:phosphatidylinositol alpha 1,6-mannosyltransferase